MSTSPMDELKAYAATLAESVAQATTDAAVNQALRTPSEAPVPLRQRLVTVSIAVATFLSANVGLAAAAQNAVPGDLLYGVDRAYEQLAAFVGISDAHAAERLQEAHELVDRGDVTAAVEAASTALAALNSSLEEPGIEAMEVKPSITESVQLIDDLPPAAENANAEFVSDVLAETRLLLELVEEIRLAAKDGGGAATSEAAKEIREQAQRIAEAAKNGNPPGQGGPPENQGPPQP